MILRPFEQTTIYVINLLKKKIESITYIRNVPKFTKQYRIDCNIGRATKFMKLSMVGINEMNVYIYFDCHRQCARVLWHDCIKIERKTDININRLTHESMCMAYSVYVRETTGTSSFVLSWCFSSSPSLSLLSYLFSLFVGPLISFFDAIVLKVLFFRINLCSRRSIGHVAPFSFNQTCRKSRRPFD